ncbi:MAG: J domain-containing protein [Cyanobacteriota bacterium]|nr:J domain-containing protein [Cyanobacteriota bacterium]
MGFDPRQWSGASPPRQERVTSNVQALLAENEALRREVLRLTRELERMRRPRWRDDSVPSGAASAESASTESTPTRIRREQVVQWGAALARQPGWTVLRQRGLQALIERLNRLAFPGHLTLEQRLDRLVPGLGTDLMAAVGNTTTKASMAVLAAFALYGVRASEWLEEDPRRVVLDLQQQLQQNAPRGRGRRTRTDQRKTDQRNTDQHNSHQQPREGGWLAALAVLGLEPGASADAIKQAHRRLVKQHHPDMGGSAEAFRRVNEAYQQLIA